MNRIFTLIILLLPFCSNAQLPLGRFEYSYGFQGQSFTFKKGNRFEYHFRSCTGGSKGKGTYTFNDSVLKLYFETQKGQAKYAVQTKFTPTNEDSSHVYIKFFDPNDKKAIINDQIIIKVFAVPTYQLVFGTLIYDDTVSAYISSGNFPIEISTVNIDYRRPILKFKLEKSGDYEVLCPVNHNFIRQCDNSDTMEFFVEKFNKKELLLAENKTLLAELHTRKKARLFFRKRK